MLLHNTVFKQSSTVAKTMFPAYIKEHTDGWSTPTDANESTPTDATDCAEEYEIDDNDLEGDANLESLLITASNTHNHQHVCCLYVRVGRFHLFHPKLQLKVFHSVLKARFIFFHKGTLTLVGRSFFWRFVCFGD